MIEYFLSLIGQTKTQNMLNLALIDALNVVTPADALKITRFLHGKDWQFSGNVPEDKRRQLTDFTRRMMGDIVGFMKNSGKPGVEEYSRARLEGGLFIYRGDGERSNRTLVVAFPGNGGRLMMPLPVVLQHLPARHVDVVMVPDGLKQHYQQGIRGLGETLSDALVKLPQLLPRNYSRIVCLGTSSGGVPALLAAAELGADTVLAVGAGHPDDERWDISGVSKRHLLLAAADQLANYHVTLAYGAQSADDVAAAEAISAILPAARLIPVAKPGVEIGHVALFPLMKAGEMRAFFDTHLRLPGAAASAGVKASTARE